MTRTIITPSNTSIQLTIPANYVGKAIEITCLSLEELEQKPTQKTMGDYFGIIKKEDYNDLKMHTEQAREEWDRNH